jgi:hypothetical protein
MLITRVAHAEVKPKETTALARVIKEMIVLHTETVFKIGKESSYGKHLVTHAKIRSL